MAELDTSVSIDFGSTTLTILGITVTIPNRNYVDCALAVVLGKFPFNEANREIHWLGYPAFNTRKISQWVALLVRPRVHKMGRTTEYTVGKVVNAAWDGYIDYSRVFGNPYGTNLAWFENQLKIDGWIDEGTRPFSAPGDSGSLVLDTENRPVGLLFAGDGVRYSYANHIDRVMGALRIPRI